MDILFNTTRVEELKEKWSCPITGAFHHLVAAYTALDDRIEFGDGERFGGDITIVNALETAIEVFEERHNIVNVDDVKCVL